MGGLRGFSRILMAVIGAALVGLASACGAPVAGSDQRASNAPTIVSLNPCLDAILVEVAKPEQILALSHYSRDPSSSSIPQDVARAFAVTGGTAEEVFALNPDIVLASTFIAPPAKAAFERLGLRIETFGSPVTIEESTGQIRTVADLVDGDPDALIGDIERSVGGTDQPAISTLLWQPGQIVPGGKTLIAELLDRNNFTSHSQKMGLEQADHVTLERILSDPPQLLLVAGSSAGQTHPLLRDLKETRVETLDPQLLYCGGRTIVAAQERLDAIRTEIAE